MTAFESYFLNKEFVWKPGLERIKKAVASLDFSFPPSVIVAGTNGKGSTSSFIASILKAHGVRTGLFTSPHLLEFNERFRIDLEPVDTGLLDRAFLNLLPVIEENSLTYFEAAFLLSLYLFKDCDFVVYEVGLGGRLDATNSIEHNLAVITHIDYDHKDYLGETIEEIATEKLHVVKNRIPVVISQNRKVVFDIATEFTDEIYAFGSDFNVFSVRVTSEGTKGIYSDKEITFPFNLSVYGKHQAINAATGIFTAKKVLKELLCLKVDISKIKGAVSSVTIPGRFEILRRKPFFIVDVAHNIDAVGRFVETLGMLGISVDIVYSGLKDKDFNAIFKLFKSYTDEAGTELFLVPIKNPRGFSYKELKEKYGKEATVLESLKGEVLKKDVAVVGSFYLISDVLNGNFK
ncbi:bifunctional folylpolyglutamate synthase/dihydrofolate synthase [Desulfurobacterium atlanticum]|uniref:Dihydrofolate synthase / folylpolyglutamate synthase n=1 Tax=Desulfurobacterium atlanticum TaxID=240169 RepID=A0A239A9D9_9BACT|nr:Mur ligase family protein [Desulfurobacterium atlanticum]SNR92245.1 dihydrofolate synthase / folylpolyglutamate synthase [Desulfurobacterium atlanticum]